MIGDLEQARKFVAGGMKIQENSGIEAMLSMHYWIYSMVLLDSGNLEEALRFSEKTMDLSKRNSEQIFSSPITMPQWENSMKIQAISSSPKRDGNSNSELLLNHLARGMREAGGEVRINNLLEKNIKTCIGCFTCWTKTPGRCIHMDDMNQELLSLMPASDLVIYATALYNHTMNATMSNFRERLLPLSQPFTEKRDGKFERKLRKKLPPAV